MLIIVTIGLLFAGIVLFVTGFVSGSVGYIYLSIACGVVAAIFLIAYLAVSRRRTARWVDAAIVAPRAAAARRGDPAAPTGVPDGRDSPGGVAIADELTEPIGPGWEPPAGDREGHDGGEGDEGDAVGAGDLAEDDVADRQGAEEVTGAEAVSGVEADGQDRAGAEALGGDETVAEDLAVDHDLTVGEDLTAGYDLTAGDDEPEEAWSEVGVDDGHVFPIADYDTLRVDQIVPLLVELFPDELEEVRDRELAGKARVGVLRRCATLLDRSGAG